MNIPTPHAERGAQAFSQATEHAVPRHDGYLGIHKALRRFMSHTLLRVGATDPTDTDEVQATLEQVGELMDLCELHIKDENEFIHPALEQARPGFSARIAGEHVHHVEAIHDLRDLAALAAHTQGPARSHAIGRLYKAMALFVSDNFAHMHYEETQHNAMLWAHYSDAELIDIERRLVASIPPQMMFKALHWFMPALNAPERTAMLRGMQAGMPPDAFLGVLDIAQRTLKPADHLKLLRSLSLAPVRT